MQSLQMNPLVHRIADMNDRDSLLLLINGAFRGESSCQGWTTEHSLLGGQRMDIDMLTSNLNDKNSIILLFFNTDETMLIGCVYLKQQPPTTTAYLGLLTVRPELQSHGYGKFILSVAENYLINNWNVESVEMTVIKQRQELLSFYNRRGYYDTGRREPFPLDDPKFGLPKRRDLEFCILKKDLKMKEQ